MSFPYTEEMMESVKKVEATRAARMAAEPRRMTAEEKDALLKEFHPDYKEEAFAEIKIGPNKGQKAPKELVHLLHSNSRLLTEQRREGSEGVSRAFTGKEPCSGNELRSGSSGL